MITLDVGMADGLVLEEDGDLIEQRSALHDPEGLYRFGMTRCWAPEAEQLVVIMLNPSVAGAFASDPTTGKVCKFARRDGRFGGFVVLNAFAFQSPKPRALRLAADPVGPATDAVITAVLEQAAGGSALLAWGAPDIGVTLKAVLERRTAWLGDMVRKHAITPLCLGQTQGGQPRHPLFVPDATPLTTYEI